jgi:hypothetical protein
MQVAMVQVHRVGIFNAYRQAKSLNRRVRDIEQLFTISVDNSVDYLF